MDLISVAVFLIYTQCVVSLDNGLALTPPMGWLSWERYRCQTDCVNYPDDCISEKLYMRMADLLVSEGYKDLGYEYVNIDDCWMAKKRDQNGSLVADPERFPHGIKALADYVHSKGLKLGIYEDFGTHTCGGYPGSKFYLEQDAELFASWGVDMLKLDGCYTDIKDMDDGYPDMQGFLNRTGRPILYSCSWPAYVVFSKQTPNYHKIAKYCNIWRNYGDIGDSWDSVQSIIEFYGEDKGRFSEVAGPGAFNDPDMIIVGNYGLSYDQQQAQLALWAIMASPLLMSNDLGNMDPESKKYLQNKNMIRINQDPLGLQGQRLFKLGKIDIWIRVLAPAKKSGAFAILNLNSGGGPTKPLLSQLADMYESKVQGTRLIVCVFYMICKSRGKYFLYFKPKVEVPAEDLGLIDPNGYNVTDVFGEKFLGLYKPSDNITMIVNPSGAFLGLAEIVKP